MGIKPIVLEQDLRYSVTLSPLDTWDDFARVLRSSLEHFITAELSPRIAGADSKRVQQGWDPLTFGLRQNINF